MQKIMVCVCDKVTADILQQMHAAVTFCVSKYLRAGGQKFEYWLKLKWLHCEPFGVQLLGLHVHYGVHPFQFFTLIQY